MLPDAAVESTVISFLATEAMKNLANLQVLDLRHNKFKEVPSVVYELRTLKTLYLRFNKIRTVSPNIGKLEVRKPNPSLVCVPRGYRFLCYWCVCVLVCACVIVC